MEARMSSTKAAFWSVKMTSEAHFMVSAETIVAWARGERTRGGR